MNISMAIAQTQLQNLKEEFAISPELPYKLNVEIWKHSAHKSMELSCNISVFTTPNHVEQTSGATFTDAINAMRLKLKASLPAFQLTDEEVNIKCTLSSSTTNTPPTQS